VELIRSVQRACGLLSAFSTASPRLTLAELSERVGLPKPTVYRLAATLVESGFMAQHQDGRYGLGARAIGVGAVARADLDLIAVCGHLMERLAQRTGETVLLGIADWATIETTIVHRIDSAHELSVVSHVGRRAKITLGAIGKALLLGLDPAELEQVMTAIDRSAHTERTITGIEAALAEVQRCRLAGFATESEEFLTGVSAVAAPVTLGGPWPAGAVAVVGPAARLDDRLAEVGKWLVDELGHLTSSPV
jgi:DNA-binding IclR family transcriptional regulator